MILQSGFSRLGTALLATLAVTTHAQSLPEKPLPSAVITSDAGNSDADLLPPARLSPAIKPRAIKAAMRLVANWQVAASRGRFNQDWTYAPLYLGLLAASDATGDASYRNIVEDQSARFAWKLWANRDLHADDEAIAQAYEDLYDRRREPVRIADARATFDRLAALQDSPRKDLWWWCDALFMAPAGLARMSAITGDRKYVLAMDREWTLTQEHLYNPQQRLFYRDASYFTKREANGEPVYWTRGNGWVLAGTANVLQAMALDDPLRPKYLRLFQDMSQRIASLQQPDGLWRPSLLDPQSYSLPEVSGSAFFVYALAWGVNHGVLDRAIYGPVIERAWAAMLLHVYSDGRLGCIQPIGAAPGAFTPTSSYVYGVGGFLLAGREMLHFASPK